MEVSKLVRIFRFHNELEKISRQLHKQDENACNYGLTSRQEKLVERLEKQAEEIAKKLGYNAYHQSDPRGCSLYIGKKLTATDYSCKGIPIY